MRQQHLILVGMNPHSAEPVTEAVVLPGPERPLGLPGPPENTGNTQHL